MFNFEVDDLDMSKIQYKKYEKIYDYYSNEINANIIFDINDIY